MLVTPSWTFLSLRVPGGATLPDPNLTLRNRLYLPAVLSSARLQPGSHTTQQRLLPSDLSYQGHPANSPDGW